MSHLRSAALLVPLLALGCQPRKDQPPVEPPAQEEQDVSQAVPETTGLPTLDTTAPERFETATFGLG